MGPIVQIKSSHQNEIVHASSTLQEEATQIVAWEAGEELALQIWELEVAWLLVTYYVAASAYHHRRLRAR